MRLDPPFLTAPPLSKALLGLADIGHQTWWFAGPVRLARALGRSGATVRPWDPAPGSEDAPLAPPQGVTHEDIVVLYHALGRRERPDLDLRHLVSQLPGGTQVALCEPASYGRVGRWLTRRLRATLGRPALGMDPGELSTLCLCAGLTSLHQTWPQGIRSLVLVTGAVHPVAGRPASPTPASPTPASPTPASPTPQ